jgi:deoxyribodipyrimidine photo-lyase
MTQLNKKFKIMHVFAHQEIGVKLTFDRDISVAKFCNQHQITFNEFQRDGVQRGLRNRKTWNKDWKDFMSQFTQEPDWSRYIKIETDKITEFDNRGDVSIEVKSNFSDELFTGKVPNNNLDIALEIIATTFHLEIKKISSNKIIFERK